MIFIYSMIIAIIFIGLFKSKLKSNTILCYTFFILMSLLAIIFAWGGFQLPDFVNHTIIPIIARGGLAGAFFIIVMITGALPNKTRLIKLLMPIRGELSIIASVLTIGHNIAYGKTYFVALFSKKMDLPLTQKIAAVLSMIMIGIMMPLFVTSFKCIRKKMKAKSWKRLQRLAYVFYALLCAHIMLLCIPQALLNRTGYRLTVIVYGTVFLAYFACRIIKASRKLQPEKLMKVDAAITLFAVVSVCFLFYHISVGTESSNTDVIESNANEQTIALATSVSEIKDGKYTGKGMGNSGYITVEIEVKDEKLVSITVVKQLEDEPYWSDATAIIDKIVESNTSKVDAVSGATYSSEGIKDAVKEAMILAGFTEY